MIKNFKILNIFLVALMVLGSFSGIYATTLQDHNNNVSVDNAKTIYVAKNGTDRNDGLTPNQPKKNIAIAINSANPGDTIQVGPGTYQENLQINKNITINGKTQNNTIIDAQQTNNCVIIQPEVTVKITNFTLKNGKQRQYTDNFGGGIYNQGNLTLINSTITDNNAEYGGGIYNLNTMAIKGVTIKNNKATYSGGGINNPRTMTIEDSTITDNTATKIAGGGIINRGTMNINRSSIENNHATRNGGGIDSTQLTIEDSTITNNTAGDVGGGISSYFLCAYGCTITNNRATNGGRIYTSAGEGSKSFLDDFTVNMARGNSPNNFAGQPYTPA
jgi:predicted outer membrane repeat protein